MGLFSGIGGAVGSFWGPVGTAVGSGVGSLLDGAASSAIDYKFNNNMLERQFALQYDLYRKTQKAKFEADKQYHYNTPSWDVEGLKRAGLNPILAAGSLGASSASAAGSTGSASYPSVNPASRAIQSAAMLASIEKTDAEIDATKQLGYMYSSSAKQNEANTRLIAEQIAQIRRENKFYDLNPNVFAGKLYSRMNTKSGWFGALLNMVNHSAKPDRSSYNLQPFRDY